MMKTSDRITERLPGFYNARERNSLLYRLINSFAKAISEQQKELFSVMKAHWVDTAYGGDLDILASLFELTRKMGEDDDDFRLRIKSAILDFRGGGTVEAIRVALARYLAIPVEDVVLIENPPYPKSLPFKVRSRDKWMMSSSSINDEKCAITISIADGEVRKPTIINLDNNLSLKYDEIIKAGETLTIRDGAATLDGIDVTAKLVAEKPREVLTIPRKSSAWQYREGLSDTLGRFNDGKFDEHVFYKDVPATNIRFDWTANLIAAFEVRVPSSALEKHNVTKSKVEELVNTIKAVGIKAIVNVVER
jgi:hypothetical protein